MFLYLAQSQWQICLLKSCYFGFNFCCSLLGLVSAFRTIRSTIPNRIFFPSTREKTKINLRWWTWYIINPCPPFIRWSVASQQDFILVFDVVWPKGRLQHAVVLVVSIKSLCKLLYDLISLPWEWIFLEKLVIVDEIKKVGEGPPIHVSASGLVLWASSSARLPTQGKWLLLSRTPAACSQCQSSHRILTPPCTHACLSLSLSTTLPPRTQATPAQAGQDTEWKGTEAMGRNQCKGSCC